MAQRVSRQHPDDVGAPAATDPEHQVTRAQGGRVRLVPHRRAMRTGVAAYSRRDRQQRGRYMVTYHSPSTLRTLCTSHFVAPSPKPSSSVKVAWSPSDSRSRQPGRPSVRLASPRPPRPCGRRR